MRAASYVVIVHFTWNQNRHWFVIWSRLQILVACGWARTKEYVSLLERTAPPPSSSVGRTLPTSLRLLCRQLYRRTSSVVYWRQSGERLGESFQLTMMGGAIYIRILWNRSSYPTKAWTNFFSLIVVTNSPTNSFIEIFAISFFVTKIFNFPIFRFLQCTIILRTIFANV